MLMGIAADLYDVSHEVTKGELLTAASPARLHPERANESFMRGPADQRSPSESRLHRHLLS
jgi:hypothetical protein